MKTIKTTIKNFALLITLICFGISANAKEKNATIYLAISHQVSDFDKWKPGFDNDLKARKKAGLKDIFVKQDINNPNSITAFFEVTDMKKAEAFLANPKLKEAMEKAGVTSPPVITFYKSAADFGKIKPNALITMISHSVRDFNTWKTVYDSATDMRAKAGIQDYLVLRSLADENVVMAVGTASSIEAFGKFMANPNLKEAMEKAGATSQPVVSVFP